MSGAAKNSGRENIAVYPGSFDPMHIGHISVAARASNIFDRLIVVIAVNPEKKDKYMFSTDEKIRFARESLSHIDKVSDVFAYEGGLTVDQARDLGANTMIRGLRSVTDFEQEIELHLQNTYVQEARGIKPGDPEFVDTVSWYRLPNEDHISGKLGRFFVEGPSIQDRASLIRPLVSEIVFDAMMARAEELEARG
jgi:pantetheine-phosphate adenylyltransferase